MDEKIINLISNNKIQEAKQIFAFNIKRISQMNNLIYTAFLNKEDSIGKEIIRFGFMINNQGFHYHYSPFDFFCYVCKNDYLEILFRIIEDSYFWNKDKVIFEPEHKQSPRQWLIATAGYIMCTLNKIKSLEILCDKYNITKFDAQETHFFEVATKSKYEDLFTFLVNRYGIYSDEYNGICETSLYDVPKYYKKGNSVQNQMYMGNQNLSIENPMYMENKINKRNNDYDYTIPNIPVENPMYMETKTIKNNDYSEINKKPRVPVFEKFT